MVTLLSLPPNAGLDRMSIADLGLLAATVLSVRTSFSHLSCLANHMEAAALEDLADDAEAGAGASIAMIVKELGRRVGLEPFELEERDEIVQRCAFLLAPDLLEDRGK